MAGGLIALLVDKIDIPFDHLGDFGFRHFVDYPLGRCGQRRHGKAP
jgi:hypothetical protein